ATASCAALGVIPTRNSCGLISLGQPIFIVFSLLRRGAYDQTRILRRASNCFEFWGDTDPVRGNICE
ncbi:MAG: hypothetical protein Q8O82_14600, partial [Pseudorhodobacter sp.]|nr:hypothetical protein [Pseudorhodobacter sp.]